VLAKKSGESPWPNSNFSIPLGIENLTLRFRGEFFIFGQNRGVQVFKLVTKNTVEEHIHDLIERKKGLLEDIIGETDADQINYLSRDELIQVFEKMMVEAE
jgi:hypothetical protein